MANAREVMCASSGYGLSVISGGIFSVAVIPVVIIVAGAHTRATTAVAQGVGMVLAGAGGGVTGLTETAQLKSFERGQYYVGSLVSRVWLLLPVAVVCSSITIVLVPSQPAVAILALLSALLPALSAGFFFVGERSALRFLLLETIPRQAGSLVAALFLFATGNALWLVRAQLQGGLVTTITSSASILGRYRGWHLDLSFVRMRQHIPAVSMPAVSTMYVNVPIVVVQIFLPQITATHALAERIMRLALYGTRPYVQITQSYVSNDDPDEQLRRARRIAALSVYLGIAGALAYAVATQWAGLILSGGQLHIDYVVSITQSLAPAAVLISQVTGFAVLTTYRMTPALASSTTASAVVGGVGLIPAALVWGLIGVTSVLALSEIVVLVYQLAVLRRSVFRSHRVS